MKKIFEFFYNKQNLSLSLAATSALVLASAYISQYGFGLDPCALCFYQRKPYFVVIGLSSASFFALKKHERISVAMLWGCVLSLIAGSAIAAFHVGVEQHWWKGLEACSNYALPQNVSVEEMKKFIMSRSIVQCDVPAFVFLGISMAGYNFLISTGMALSAAFFLIKKKA